MIAHSEYFETFENFQRKMGVTTTDGSVVDALGQRTIQVKTYDNNKKQDILY